MAPEMLLREFSDKKAATSDVWALGAILYKYYYRRSIFDNVDKIESEIIEFRN